MSDVTPRRPTHDGGMSRRTLLGGAAAVGGAGLVAAGVAPAHAAGPAGRFPQAIEPPVDGLTYVSLDAVAFDVADTSSASYRLYQDLTGMQPEPSAAFLNAPLPIPIGSTIRRIDVGFQGQPIVSVQRRTLLGERTDIVTPTSLAAGGGPKSQTLTVDATLTAEATYAVRAFCSAGDSVFGMTIGYQPPPQSFVPYSGSEPRALDTRSGSPVAPGDELVVDLSSRLTPGARAAVFNLTATQTSAYGWLAAFPDGISWPGNSSLNFDGAGQTVANGVICATTAGKLKIRCGPATTHVIVDVIGSML